MKKIIIFILIFLTIILIGAGILFCYQKGSQSSEINNLPTIQPDVSPTAIKKEKEISKLSFPIAEFEERITKKTFGIYITPQNSPVRPERFSGYHTGVDVEYENTAEEVPIYAIYECEVILKRWVSGYGGTMILKCDIVNQEFYILYGHLSEESFIKKNTVKKGERIAILGKGKTRETDFERKHLHFAIMKNNLDLRGYVQNNKELENWYDPIDFYKNFK
jgi:murein DD-endopeptidase MepM/ murein hydrolase activator NlpD